jgi:hypothetical protein
MKSELQIHLESRLEQFVNITGDYEKAKIKKELMARRNAEIVKVKANAKINHKNEDADHTHLYYNVHLQYLIKQKDRIYLEEEIEQRKATFYLNRLYDDREVIPDFSTNTTNTTQPQTTQPTTITDNQRKGYTYDRLKAVQYAERWWNDYNPEYKKFDVDCTNFISQCLHQGGAPMRGYPNKGQGWWQQNNSWSYSWAVANSLRKYLSNSKIGLQAIEVGSPLELKLGDVLCLDFQGDGRFDHNTIVTAKDAYGMPLVNAHTYNSRMRYWAYEDSSAYTPNIKYKFFTIVDNA